MSDRIPWGRPADASCANCMWWRRYSHDSETGICRSVTRNEYGGAVLVTVTERESLPVVLNTNEDFLCKDWEADDARGG